MTANGIMSIVELLSIDGADPRKVIPYSIRLTEMLVSFQTIELTNQSIWLCNIFVVWLVKKNRRRPVPSSSSRLLMDGRSALMPLCGACAGERCLAEGVKYSRRPLSATLFISCIVILFHVGFISAITVE